MKLKGINKIEQHADKLVLGIAGIAMAAAGALAVFPQGNMVKVGTQTVPPGQAFQPVERLAEDLQRDMDSTNPRLPEAPKFEVGKAIAVGREVTPAVPGQHLSLGAAPRFGAASTTATAANAAYNAPMVPAPANTVAVPYSVTISPLEQLRHPDLAAILPKEQPFDKAAVSIEASFNGADLKALLEADPDGAGPQEPIPSSWWRDALGGNELVTIVAVEVERQTVANPDDSAPADTKTTIFSSMPGRENTLKLWNDTVKVIGDMPSMVDQIRMMEDQVQRPSFYETIAGAPWQQPTKVTVASGDVAAKDRQIKANRDKESAAMKGLEKLQKDLATAPDAKQVQEERRQSSPEQPAGRGGRGGAPAAPRTTEKKEAKPTQTKQ